MNIALVSQEYPPETAHGGIATQTYMRAHGLTELGHEVFVISHSLNNERNEYQDKYVSVIRIPGFDSRFPIFSEPVRWLTYSAEVAVEISKLNQQTPLDLVVFPEWGGEGYIHLLNQTESNYIPTLVHIHGPLVMFAHTMNWPEINSEFYRVGSIMESTCLRLATAISASNKCSAGWCVKHYGLDASAIPVLYTGIDTGVFYPRNVSKAPRPTIIFVGSLRFNKGVDLLVEAACILSKDFPDLQVRIVGKGDPALINKLRQIVAEREVQDLLDFRGHVKREDLPLHLSEAHFFAGPSTYEGGPGNVYLEAMACGIPAIGCSGSGVDGIITSFKNGFLVPPHDLKALTESMRKLLVDTKLCKRLGENARKYVVTEADSKTCMKKLENFYDSISKRTSLNFNLIQHT